MWVCLSPCVFVCVCTCVSCLTPAVSGVSQQTERAPAKIWLELIPMSIWKKKTRRKWLEVGKLGWFGPIRFFTASSASPLHRPAASRDAPRCFAQSEVEKRLLCCFFFVLLLLPRKCFDRTDLAAASAPRSPFFTSWKPLPVSSAPFSSKGTDWSRNTQPGLIWLAVGAL